MFKNDISQFRFKKESLLSILTWLFFCLTVISIISLSGINWFAPLQLLQS